MNSVHKQSEFVRAYLLGTMADDEAAAIETKYFTDPSFFRQIQAAEQALIEDYLDGRLKTADKERFESRYLHVPQLVRAVNEVRERRSGRRRAAIWPTWQLVAAGTVLCGLGLGAWMYLEQQEAPERPAIAQTRPAPNRPAVSLHLIPGLTKDGGVTTPVLGLRSSSFPLQLIAELPGQTAPVECTATISIVDADGQWKRVWTGAQPIRSTAGAGGQQLAVALDSSVLQPGDYAMEVTSVDGRVSETYVFRVSPSTRQ